MVKAPHGNKISCKDWLQEAALRKLIKKIDPDEAEIPEEMIVYGGIMETEIRLQLQYWFKQRPCRYL